MWLRSSGRVFCATVPASTVLCFCVFFYILVFQLAIRRPHFLGASGLHFVSGYYSMIIIFECRIARTAVGCTSCPRVSECSSGYSIAFRAGVLDSEHFSSDIYTSSRLKETCQNSYVNIAAVSTNIFVSSYHSLLHFFKNSDVVFNLRVIFFFLF